VGLTRTGLDLYHPVKTVLGMDIQKQKSKMKPKTLTAEETMSKRDLIDEYRRHQIEIKRLRALCVKYKDEIKELRGSRVLLLEAVNGNCS